jgi:hypothetical protein
MLKLEGSASSRISIYTLLFVLMALLYIVNTVEFKNSYCQTLSDFYKFTLLYYNFCFVYISQYIIYLERRQC